MGIAHYNKKGLYSGYDRNNKERAAQDYYATPTTEVVNILSVINKGFADGIILEPCAGGGHMLDGIKTVYPNANIIATDIKKRIDNKDILCGDEYDFLSDDYPYQEVDYIIMNPPYAVIEPFVMRALGIASKGVLMLGRLQFLEGQARYNTIFKENPPTDVYIYVDRIACFKNGDVSNPLASAQAYAWFYWDLENIGKTECHWIRRVGE